MQDKYLLKAIKEEKLLDKFKDYKEMTREEIEYQLGWGDTNEFSWGFAIYLLNNIDKAIEYIEEHKQLSMFADLRKENTHQYDLECDADDLLKILKGEE